MQVDIPQPIRVAVFINELINIRSLPAIEELSRQPLRRREIAIEKRVIPIRERPKPRDAPAEADGIVHKVAERCQKKERDPRGAEEGSGERASREVEERVMKVIAVLNDCVVIPWAVAEERIEEINIRQERKRKAEPNERRREGCRKQLSDDDCRKYSDANVEQHTCHEPVVSFNVYSINLMDCYLFRNDIINLPISEDYME